MSDLLGYTRRNNAGDELATSEFAVITLGSGQVSLAQSFDAQLNQQVRPVFVLGDASIHWTHGYAEGRANLSRLAGGVNFFDAFQASECGAVQGLNLSTNGGRPCKPTAAGLKGILRFSDGFIESLALRMQAGTTEITEQAGMRFATVANR